ncbi:GAF domain-containing sensor histidine kinase [Siphonobacter sp. SORGH_AS_1065]|uniref:GAF domain-containing sensor histidine kinase n=1 Tax=Siphonobacter sp. SORGH_AS_1065 TaxID=3041795 RepID=UPI00277D52F7|nr:ATP-binding protein [Siphonobacter sp. SORGH_AS_1065]MDQ1089697.1 K+-sensing histidine kinase KdpD [Siphonobacter sp. SORGH_AS_1065]
MITPTIPLNEAQRLATLRDYDILDSLPEPAYDAITRLASQICGTPISLITLIDQNRQWFKSTLGVQGQETPRSESFCAHAILNPHSPLIVEDARLDDRFRDNPLTMGEPFVVFYAGIPLVTPNGYAMGTLCVIDQKPNCLSTHQLQALQDLSNQVVLLLELRKQYLQANQAREEKTRFLSTMSHEIRNALSPIISCSGLLAMEGLTSQQQELVDMLEFSSNTLQALLNDVLDYSKLEAGKMYLEQIPFSVKEMVDKIVRIHQPLSRQKNLLLEVCFASDLPDQVLGDPTRLNQIITNLLSNAIKFTETGNVIVRMSSQQETEDQISIHFEIIDTGIGIPEEALKSIFEEFSQASLDISRKYKGTGLGLSIVHLLLTLYNSRIFVESELGKGTRFFFDINFGKVAVSNALHL